MTKLFWASFAAVSFLGALKFYTDLQTRQTEKKYPPQGRFLSISGLRIHSIEKGSGRPVVFLHGSFGSSYDFTLSIFEEASKNFRAIAVDRPGFGYSQRPSGAMTPFDHMEILRQTLKELKAERPVLVVHSWAASVALAYCEKYPDEIGAVVTLGGYLAPYEGTLSWLYRLPGVPVIGDLFVHCFLTPMSRFSKPEQLTHEAFSPAPVNAVYSEAVVSLAVRPFSFKANGEDVRQLSPALRKLIPQASKIRVPWILVTGDRDSVSDPRLHAEAMSRKIPGAKLIVLKNTGHEPAFSRPEEVLRAIGEASEMADQGSPRMAEAAS